MERPGDEFDFGEGADISHTHHFSRRRAATTLPAAATNILDDSDDDTECHEDDTNSENPGLRHMNELSTVDEWEGGR